MERATKSSIWLLLVVLAALSMLGPFSIDTPFPAFSRMGREFSVSTDDMQLVVTAYMLAFALMSPFHGPISDAVGRRPVMLAGLSMYAVASVGCALSTSLPMLLGFRVLQGLSAGGGVIVSRAVIRDMFEGAEAQRLMSRVTMIFGVAPAVAPIVGGWLLTMGSWRAIFYFLVGVAVVLMALVIFILPESHPRERRTAFTPSAIFGGLVEAGRSPAFHRVSWAASLSFAGQFLYIGAAPIFVMDLLGKGEQDFWMFFVPMISGVVLGSWISSRTSGHVTINRLVSAAMAFALFGALVNLAFAVIPATQGLPYAVIGPALIAVGTGASYPALQLTLLDMFPGSRGATVSLFTFFTLVLNGSMAGFVAPHVTGSFAQMALMALALEIVAVLFWMSHLRHRPGAGGKLMRPKVHPVPTPSGQ